MAMADEHEMDGMVGTDGEFKQMVIQVRVSTMRRIKIEALLQSKTMNDVAATILDKAVADMPPVMVGEQKLE